MLAPLTKVLAQNAQEHHAHHRDYIPSLLHMPGNAKSTAPTPTTGLAPKA